MFKLFKHLAEYKKQVILIIALLIVQAYCNLSLPQYTSDIVDVGIQQGGIESAAPRQIRSEMLEGICFLLDDADAQTVRNAYEMQEDGTSRLTVKDKKTLEQLDAVMGLPEVVLTMGKEAMAAGTMGNGAEAMGNSAEAAGAAKLQETPDTLTMLQMLRAAVESGQITKEQLQNAMEKAAVQMGQMSDSVVTQKAVSFVQQEYEALGLDLHDIQLRYLLLSGAKMLGMTVIMVLAAVLVGLLASRTGAGIGRGLRKRVFEKVVSFSNTEMNHFSTASLITRSTNDIQQVQMVSVMLLRMVAYAPIVGIGGILKVSQTRTGMGWIIVVAVATSMAVVSVLVQFAMPKFKKMQTLVDRMNLVSREILTGIPVIRAFSRERFEEERFDGANRDLMKTQLFTNRVMTFMMPTMMLIMNGVTVMIVWFGAKGIDLGNLQVGDMMAFITYTMEIVMSFLMITMISIMLPRAGVAADRIDEVLKTEPGIVDQEQVRDEELAQVKGELRFEDVSFRYPGADEDALEHISFTARPGETTAIIGSTGCGKSTLVQLIPRFYDVTEGHITLDGIDIRELSQAKLHSTLGLVPQKGVLFSGTIESNLKFGGDFITDEQMEKAASIAQAAEFIDSKPDRFDSAISQGGTNVSGGQKQRLSIARAVARDPKVFLFDDSFSALDYKTDVALRKALNEKVSHATVIIVAQRISTIMHADQILVLDDGRIVGCGTHEQLLEGCETYQEIARSQLSEKELKGGAGL